MNKYILLAAVLGLAFVFSALLGLPSMPAVSAQGGTTPAPVPTVPPAAAPAVVPLMYARATTTVDKLDMFDQGLVLFRERVLPMLSQADGFKGVYMLGDRKTGKSLTITLWTTEAAMKAFEANGSYQQVLALFKDYFTAPPIQEVYEVVAQAQAPVRTTAVSTGPGGATQYARVTTTMSRLDKFDDGTAVIRDSIFPAARQLDGFNGAYALQDRKTGKTIVITLWATQDTMLAGESSGFYQQQLAKVKDMLAGPPAQQDYEVGVQAQVQVPQTEANKALVRRYVDQVPNGGHFEVLADMLAPGYKRYLSASAAPLDAAANQLRLAGLRTVFPDLQITIDNMVAEGDWVVYRGVGRGTQKAPFVGILPAGKQMAVTVIEMFRFENGKIAEQWGGPDTMDMVQQMGGVVSAAPAK